MRNWSNSTCSLLLLLTLLYLQPGGALADQFGRDFPERKEQFKARAEHVLTQLRTSPESGLVAWQEMVRAVTLDAADHERKESLAFLSDSLFRGLKNEVEVSPQQWLQFRTLVDKNQKGYRLSPTLNTLRVESQLVGRDLKETLAQTKRGRISELLFQLSEVHNGVSPVHSKRRLRMVAYKALTDGNLSDWCCRRLSELIKERPLPEVLASELPYVHVLASARLYYQSPEFIETAIGRIKAFVETATSADLDRLHFINQMSSTDRGEFDWLVIQRALIPFLTKFASAPATDLPVHSAISSIVSKTLHVLPVSENILLEPLTEAINPTWAQIASSQTDSDLSDPICYLLTELTARAGSTERTEQLVRFWEDRFRGNLEMIAVLAENRHFSLARSLIPSDLHSLNDRGGRFTLALEKQLPFLLATIEDTSTQTYLEARLLFLHNGPDERKPNLSLTRRTAAFAKRFRLESLDPVSLQVEILEYLANYSYSRIALRDTYVSYARMIDLPDLIERVTLADQSNPQGERYAQTSQAELTIVGTAARLLIGEGDPTLMSELLDVCLTPPPGVEDIHPSVYTVLDNLMHLVGFGLVDAVTSGIIFEKIDNLESVIVRLARHTFRTSYKTDRSRYSAVFSLQLLSFAKTKDLTYLDKLLDSEQQKFGQGFTATIERALGWRILKESTSIFWTDEALSQRRRALLLFILEDSEVAMKLLGLPAEELIVEGLKGRAISRLDLPALQAAGLLSQFETPIILAETAIASLDEDNRVSFPEVVSQSKNLLEKATRTAPPELTAEIALLSANYYSQLKDYQAARQILAGVGSSDLGRSEYRTLYYQLSESLNKANLPTGE